MIRCDIYKSHRTPEFTKEFTLLQLEAVNDVLCKIIHQGKEAEAQSSYDKLFHGINLLSSLKDIESEIENTNDQTNKNIYIDTKKLFYVLKRRRYFGYDAVIDRITGYIEDICDNLELDKEPVINTLRSFKKHEDLMLYSKVTYRDHFMHQFHVFVVGYIIMHFIGIANITKMLNNNVATLFGKKLTIKNTLRIWFLASIFHDSCYLLSKFDENISDFLTEILGKSPKDEEQESIDGPFKFSVNFQWDQLANKKAGFLEKLSEVIECFQHKYHQVNTCKVTTEMSRLLLERNHGVLGALIMLQKMSRANIWNENIAYETEKSISALAIALHTKEAYKKTKDLLGVNIENQFLFFESYPIVFLLAYCDFLQEWGRKSSGKAKALGSPIFHSLFFDKTSKVITCNLFYTPSSCLPKQSVPPKDQLEKWASSFKSSFNSSNISFVVNYYHTASDDPQQVNLQSSIYSVNIKNRYRRQRLRVECEQHCTLISDSREAFFVNFSCDGFTDDCNIGFGTNSKFEQNEEFDLKFIYGATDLSGKYKVRRYINAASDLPYKNFVGAEKIN